MNGGVEVAEDGVNLAKASDIADVTFGVLVENSSDLVARDVTVKMTLKQKSGPTLRNTDGESVVRKSTIPYVMPGKEFGTGEDVRVPIGEVEDAPSVKTEITVGEWWQPNNDVHEFASISATVTNKQDDPDDHINVTVDSQYCDDAGVAKAGVIFRDSAGKIIYGASGFQASSDTADLISGYAPLKNYKPGKTKNLAMPNFWSISTQGAPGAGFEKQPDWEQTEIFPYADSDKG
ncbi:hypothetical protein Snas_4790 [Stackebrandtia nassauensis DSM 44728]|uniref:Uncharacterized protein n=2 Tax=Stackebrandtia TaxID=283810 RepID=D3Q8I9_STANL|nr:hypothetical protein Snas_4790 [Stackebrandtia nassauensis DSM 44728]